MSIKAWFEPSPNRDPNRITIDSSVRDLAKAAVRKVKAVVAPAPKKG